MGKKKEPSMADATNQIKDVMNRASLSNYFFVNTKIISKGPKGSVIVVPDKELWVSMINDKEISDKMKELDLKKPEDGYFIDIASYAEDINDKSWVEIDPEAMYMGKIIKIRVHENFEYDVPINKDLLPLKLKKAEFNNITYKIFINEGKELSLSLGIKKYFDYPLPESGFYIMRLFKVL